MARKKDTNLKLTQIKSSAKSNREIETYEFDSSTTLKYYGVFPDSMVQECLKDMQSLMQEMEKINKSTDPKDKKNKVEFDDNTMIQFITFLSIKHFTGLKSQIKGDFVQHISTMKDLVDSGWYKRIVDEVLDPKQIYRVMESVGDVLGSMQALSHVVESSQKQFQKLSLQNPEIFKGGVGKQIPEA